MCRRYAGKFGQMRRDNRGLLLFGGVGTGKTYTAACIANELLPQGIQVVMTSLVKLIDGGADELCSRMAAIDLLILDELGAAPRITPWSRSTTLWTAATEWDFR